MNIFTRISNGWKLAINSFKILKANKQLIAFPILSGFSLFLVIASFFTAALAESGWHENVTCAYDKVIQYSFLLIFYFASYFVLVFFDVALMHCTGMYFKGEEVKLREGLNYSISRIWAIFLWALFAATIGTVLNVLQKNMGKIGRMIIGAINIVWNIATFFVLPVIAYEKNGPLHSFKRSSQLMKENWGENIGATFSFELIQFTGIVALLVIAGVVYIMLDAVAGITIAALGIAIVLAVMSAAKSIFICAVYQHVTGNPVEHYNYLMIADLFVRH